MGRYHWWIVTRDPNDGQPFLIYGSANSEDEARQNGLEMYGLTDFEIKKYPTKDRSAASAFYRGKTLRDTHSITEARRRVGHEKSLRRRLGIV